MRVKARTAQRLWGVEGAGKDLGSDLVGRILACVLVPACLKAFTDGWVSSPPLCVGDSDL